MLPECVQNLNALLHKEPYASVAYGVYWSSFLTLCTPVATIFLLAQTAYRLIVWFLGLAGEDKYLHSKLRSRKNGDATEYAVVVTGCDSGFGKELAVWAADVGFHVFAGCLSKDSFRHFDGLASITPLVMDVTKDDQVNAAVGSVEKWIASATKDKKRVLHALCNNAGIIKLFHIDWMEMKDIQQMMDVNFFGTVRCCKAFLPLLKRQSKEGTHEGSRILNVASAAGKTAMSGVLTGYCASKHATVAFSTGLRADMAPFCIQVCTICPTFHKTSMVADAPDVIVDNWKFLPKEIAKEYGDGKKGVLHRKMCAGSGSCFVSETNSCLDVTEYQTYSQKEVGHACQYMWRMDVAVEQIMKVLTVHTVPGDIYVGTDAKFFVGVFRMMPSWLMDGILSYFPVGKKPVPACMRKS